MARPKLQYQAYGILSEKTILRIPPKKGKKKVGNANRHFSSGHGWIHIYSGRVRWCLGSLNTTIYGTGGKTIKARLFTVRFFLSVRCGSVRFNRQVQLNRTEPYGCASNKTAPRRTSPQSTATHRAEPHRTAPHRTAPHRTAPHRTAPHRIAPHRTAPHRTAP